MKPTRKEGTKLDPRVNRADDPLPLRRVPRRDHQPRPPVPGPEAALTPLWSAVVEVLAEASWRSVRQRAA